MSHEIIINDFNGHKAKSILAMESSGGKWKKLLVETLIIIGKVPSVFFIVQENDKCEVGFTSFETAAQQYNSINIPFCKESSSECELSTECAHKE